MRLKRIYHHDDEGQPTKLSHIEVIDTGTTEAQSFSTKLVAEGLAAGWIGLTDKELELRVLPEALHYKILRAPGRYCLHCQEKLQDDDTGAQARGHVLSEHPGMASPDPSIPAGYVKINAYECILDSKQHKKHQAKRIGA